jgi:hypothetical protein
MSARQELIGVLVDSFSLDDDHEGATLKGTKDSVPIEFRLVVDADCCSNTWIESIIEESALVWHTIVSTEDLDLPGVAANGNDHTALGENFYEDEMTFYGFAITTDRGKCVLDYRNSSNGYYGGSLSIKKIS